MGEVVAKIGHCCCQGLEPCALLRVTASLRWTGWVPFHQNPATTVVTTRYRDCVVVDTLEVNASYDAFILTRPPTPAEEADPANSVALLGVGLTNWTAGATEYNLYFDGDGNPVNFVWATAPELLFTRTITAWLWGDEAISGWRPIGTTGCTVTTGAASADTEWPADGLPAGHGCAPVTPPQYLFVAAHCVSGGETEIRSTRPQVCCPSNCTGFTTDWAAMDTDGFPVAGNGCPAGIEDFPNPYRPSSGSSNAQTNLSEVAFRTLFASLVGRPAPDAGYPQVSEDGLVMTCRWTDLNGDRLTRQWTLSGAFTLAEAEAAAHALLGRVTLVAGSTYLGCGGEEVVFGCGVGEYDRLAILEDPVCVDGVVVQNFTVVGEEHEQVWGEILPDAFLSARTRRPAMGPGCGQYLLLTKSAAQLLAGEICEVVHSWTNDVSPATQGAPTCAASAAGIRTSAPPSGWWGHTYWQP
jgi:hypothetical protein